MPSEPYEPGSPADWMARARSNLVLARQPKPDEALWEDLCFQAQQAAEKALKAVLIAYGVGFTKTHSIEALLDLMPECLLVSEELRRTAVLTDYAVTTRYPGDYPLVSEDEYHEALGCADMVLAWAERMLAGRMG